MTDKPLAQIAHDLQQRVFLLEKSLADMENTMRDIQYDLDALNNKTKGNKKV